MSDFFESARSSGVIGITLIIFLLIGFGALFLAVFDDRLNGENASKLKGMIHEQGAELYGLESELEWAEAALLEQKRIEVIASDLNRKNKELEILTQKESALTEQIDSQKKAIEQLSAEQVAYREQYRAYAREKAIGEKIEELTLASGKVLKKVEIREILPDKIRFTTEFGTKSVAWDEFSDDMRERFQVGEGELEAHQAKLAAIQARRNQLAAEGRNERGVYLREMELKKSLTRVERSLAEKSKGRDRAKVQAAAFRAKASQYKTKSYSSSYNQKTNMNIARRAEATKIISGIVAGLAYGSTKGVTHRDIKLSNVLISSDGVPQLVETLDWLPLSLPVPTVIRTRARLITRLWKKPPASTKTIPAATSFSRAACTIRC